MQFKMSDDWYKNAGDNDMYMETGDVKTCPHRYVFLEMCDQCNKENK